MPVIKRYPNRKLYDTEAKQYITLDGVADLIRQGVEVHVIDYASGEDLTALTLAQVIMEMEKKQGGSLPRTVLAGLIKAGGDRLSALQKNLAFSINFWQDIDEEIKRRIDGLVNRGELEEQEAGSLLHKLIEQGRRLRNEILIDENQLKRVLDERKVPSKDDLTAILNQLEELSARLDEIQSGKPSAG